MITFFFDAWLHSQELIIENLVESTKKFQYVLYSLRANGGSKSDAGDFQHVYTSWTTSVLNALREMDTADMSLLKETLSKTLGGSNAYMKIYEDYEPWRLYGPLKRGGI